MTFDPDITQRVAVAVRRRVVKDWRSRLRDFSTWGIFAALAWETMRGIWGDYIPRDVADIVTKLALTFAAVGKFIHQGHIPGLPAEEEPKP